MTALFVIGTLRHEISEIEENIESILDVFSPIAIVIFSDSQFFPESKFEMVRVPKSCTTTTTINGYSVISALYFSHIQKYCETMPAEISNIVIIRNDMKMKFSGAVGLLDVEKTWVLPRVWWNLNPASFANSNFFIISRTKFVSIDFSEERINKISPNLWDTEALFVDLFTPDSIISMEDVEFYKLDGTTKFTWDGSRLFDTSFPVESSFLHCRAMNAQSTKFTH